MISEMQYNKIQIFVIKIFEMTHPQNYMSLYLIMACSIYILIYI